MKIDRIEIIPIAIDRNEVFRIATGSELTSENVLVDVKSGVHEGWGNGAPNSVTKETTESMLSALTMMQTHLTDKDLEVENIWEELYASYPKDPSALAALDMALWDMRGKEEDKSVYQLLGGRSGSVLTDRTIGIMSYEETIEHARDYMEQGFKALKIKIGLELMEDIRRVEAVRETVGPDIPLWVDANQGYSVQEALTLCNKLVEFDIEFIEQPVKEDDLTGLKHVTSESDIPIMADEAVKDHSMAERIITEELADMVNIKLMKCGGITGGMKIAEVIDAYGVGAMVGCMGEDMLAIAAGVHVCLSSDNIRYADLDSHFMLSDSVSTGLEFREGRLWLTEEKGLGIRMSREKIERYRMDLEAAR